MGQKVNPHGLRVGVIKDWDSRWFAKKADFGDTLVEDYNLRKTLKKQLYLAGVPKIEIERDASKVRIHIHCAKPGMVIGKGGAEIEKLRAQLEAMMKKQVAVNIIVKYCAAYAVSVCNGERFRVFRRRGILVLRLLLRGGGRSSSRPRPLRRSWAGFRQPPSYPLPTQSWAEV